ncbi:MAG: hypothetical protein MUP21_12020, partial [Dehalococcoidia bacterium]|nr:hypothetical protein [Dehalococcoidia bacterium]
MNLSGFLSLIESVPSYRELIQGLKAAKGERKVFVTGTAKPCLIAGLYHHLGLPILVITARTENARQIYEEIPHWLGSDASIKYFPEPDALPYERLSSDTFTVQQRLRVLSDLIDCREAPVVIASAYAVARKTVPAARFASSCHRLSKGSKIDLERMLAGWVELGYVVESTVDMPGTASRRGGIVDIFPPNSELPARIELFGNEVDSIRFFDPVTQRSLKPVNEIVIFPAREMVASYAELNGAVQQLDVSTLSDGAKNRINDAKAQFASGKWFDGLDFYTSLVNDGALIDYLPDNTLIIVDEPGLVESAVTELDAQATEIYQVQNLQGELPLHLPVPYFNWPELVSRFNRFEQRIGLEEWDGASRAYVIGFSPAPGYSGYVPDFLKDIMEMRNDGCRITIISQQSGRLSELLAEHDILVSPVTDVAGLPPPGAITLVQGSLSGGWKLEHEGVDIVFSDAEIFGFVKKRRMVSRHPIPRDAFLSELSQGDYVVHVDHGIARFTGLTKVALDNSEREYLVLEYAAADKLYVPTEQADRVSRYIGPGGYAPSLSRLGTREWNRAKQRVKEAAENLARELLSLYSAREVVSGFNFSQDTLWQQEVEASFPYIETQDQLKAVQEVK